MEYTGGRRKGRLQKGSECCKTELFRRGSILDCHDRGEPEVRRRHQVASEQDEGNQVNVHWSSESRALGPLITQQLTVEHFDSNISFFGLSAFMTWAGTCFNGVRTRINHLRRPVWRGVVPGAASFATTCCRRSATTTAQRAVKASWVIVWRQFVTGMIVAMQSPALQSDHQTIIAVRHHR